MRIGKFKLYKEKAGIISEKYIWVFIDFQKSYLYTGQTLFKLLHSVVTEWRHDIHLVG